MLISPYGSVRVVLFQDSYFYLCRVGTVVFYLQQVSLEPIFINPIHLLGGLLENQRNMWMLIHQPTSRKEEMFKHNGASAGCLSGGVVIGVAVFAVGVGIGIAAVAALEE